MGRRPLRVPRPPQAAVARRRPLWGSRARRRTSLSRVWRSRALAWWSQRSPTYQAARCDPGPSRRSSPSGLGFAAGWRWGTLARVRPFIRARCLPATANRPSSSCFLLKPPVFKVYINVFILLKLGFVFGVLFVGLVRVNITTLYSFSLTAL